MGSTVKHRLIALPREGDAITRVGRSERDSSRQHISARLDPKPVGNHGFR